MARCFLCFSASYEHLLDPVKRLLEVIGFEVDLFDGPDERTATTSVQDRIQNADCLVVLYGPAHDPAGTPPPYDPAEWPLAEALMAQGRKIPVALIQHPGTRFAQGLDPQTPPRFDFWKPESFLRNSPHVVKALLDLKRRVDLPPGTLPQVFTRGMIRNRIQQQVKQAVLLLDCYHEVIARQPLETLHHGIDAGVDATARMPSLNLVDHEIEVTMGGDSHRATVRFGRADDHEIEYFVDIEPALQPGEKLGYRRTFFMPNRFPLTRADLAAKAADPRFPSIYRRDGTLFYGDSYDIFYELENIALAFHVPRRYPLASWRAVVLEYHTKAEYRPESERCNDPEFLTMEDDPANPERVLTLTVPRPLMNYSYYLLYEPGA